MPTLPCLLSTDSVYNAQRLTYSLVAALMLVLGLTGCGQKGALYIDKPNSPTIVASQELDSTSNPQDAAFATLDDNEYQKQRYLEQKQVLPEVSDDPNDY